MNDYQFDTTQLQSTHQPRAYTSEQYSSQNDKINDLFNDIGTGMAIIMAISVAVFILWIWSMISMIALNGKFSDFLREYRENEVNKNTRVLEDLDAPIISEKDSATEIAEESQPKEEAIPPKQDPKRLIILLSICAALVLGALVLLWVVN